MEKIQLHLGCGSRNFGDGWIHIDGGDYEHLKYTDITELQFEENSVDLIYASHVLEYFDQVEVCSVLKEWYRVLKPKGVLRVAVPDFNKIATLYLNKTKGYTLKNGIGPLYGRMVMGGQIIYHKMVYDFNTLKEILEKTTFRKVREYDWKKTTHSLFDDHSQAYYPHMDKISGTLISLNVECIK